MSSRSENSDDAAQRMLAAVPRALALGRGPVSNGGFSRHDYHHPAAGWGAAESVGHVLERAGEPIDGFRALFLMNHEDGGFDCPGCAWPDDPTGLRLDLCENGVKHVTWELTRKQVDREFFAAHTVNELTGWSDYDLEAEGRLSEPMSYDAASDRYVPISWEEAFELVGSALRGLESPHQASFYTSGRLSNEATFLYQLWVREFGTNNLPDCSNMCHEASGRALMASIGTGKGTVDLNDWERADAIWLIGDNAATNAPRMLTWLAEADRRGAQLVHINPLIEAASRRTIVPHEFVDMATFHSTDVGTMTVQVRIGGDMALMRGVAKAVLEDISGKGVSGYRAPSFSVGPDNVWAFDCISEAGYRYSSSVYPIRHDHYGVPDGQRFAHESSPGVLELPVATVRMFSKNWPAGGGGYFRLLPYFISRWSIRRINDVDRKPAMFYFHPWELDPDQPRVKGIRAKTRFRHYLNLKRTEPRLRRLVSDFRWDRVDRVFLNGGA